MVRNGRIQMKEMTEYKCKKWQNTKVRNGRIQMKEMTEYNCKK